MRNKLVLTLFALLLVLSTVAVVSAQPDQRYPWRPRFNASDPAALEKLERNIENYITFRIILSGINMILYGYILFIYTQLYRETSSKFSLALMALSAVLLIYAISSNPLILKLLRSSEPIWFNVFNVIPDIFSSLAAAIMIYLTRT
jgi:hypothetical protein